MKVFPGKLRLTHPRVSYLAVIFLLAGIITSCSPATEDTVSYFPDENWEEIADPEAAGWSEEKLIEVEAFTDTLETAAVVVLHKGKILRKWGKVDKKYKCHSIRKSFLSALYGVHVGRGTIDLSATLEDLGIDDNGPPGEYLYIRRPCIIRERWPTFDENTGCV